MRARRVATTLLLFLTASTVVTPAHASAPLREQGAAGIGDPYFPDYGNKGYRVDHYDIDATYRPATHALLGTTTLTARTTRPLSSFHLDLMLRATAVSVDGIPASFRQPDAHELVVDIGREVPARSQMTVRVEYRGRPDHITVPSHIPGVGPVSPWLQTGDEAFVNGEPEGAALWYPVNDHPVDKATYDVTAHVPPGWQAVANGGLVSHTADADSETYHWSQPASIASYQTFLGVGHYEIRQGVVNGLPYTYAWSTHLGKDTSVIVKAISQTPRRVAFLSQYLGDYPYDRYGAVVPEGNVTTLESPGGPVYSAFNFSTANGRGVSTMTHELAHQWFGDSVSIRRWRDLWLNEGLATWMTWLHTARTGGESLNQQLRFNDDLHPADDPFWERRTADPGPGHLFTSAVYVRGAMAAQALRNLMGAQAFRLLLRTWVAERAGGHGTTSAFMALAERISGRSLSRFADVWLRTAARPEATGANGLSKAAAGGS